MSVGKFSKNWVIDSCVECNIARTIDVAIVDVVLNVEHRADSA